MDGLAQVEPSAEEGVERRLQERYAGGPADEDDGGNVASDTSASTNTDLTVSMQRWNSRALSSSNFCRVSVVV